MDIETDITDPTITTPAGTPVKQVSVFLVNRVGALMSLVKLLQDHSIEVLGLSVQESTELTLLRLVLSDPEMATTLFMEKGIAHTSCTLTVVQLRPIVGTLTECLAALLAAELNIHFSYPLLVRPDDFPLLALNIEDPDLAAGALHSAGFRVLMQEDLSR